MAQVGYRVTVIGTGKPVLDARPGPVAAICAGSGKGFAKLRLLERVHRHLAQRGCDVIQCLDPWTLAIGLWHRRTNTRLRLVYESSEWFPQMFLDRKDLPVWARRLLWSVVTMLERAACRQADAILETNDTRAERFRRRGRRPVLVPNYPPLELLPPVEPERRPWIAYTGLVSPYRGFTVLLRALGMLIEKHPDLRLRVIGEFEPRGGFEQQARQLVNKCRLAAHVDFLGPLPYAEMFERIGPCLAGVILLQPERGNDYTGLPNKLFEFMGAGLGVVASDFPELRRVVNETGCGWLVDPTSPDAVARTLDQILTEPDECLRRGRLGRDAVHRRYNWHTAEAALIDTYKEILS